MMYYVGVNNFQCTQTRLNLKGVTNAAITAMEYKLFAGRPL